MKIHSAEFISSSTDYKKCPKPDKPEFAFIGRSNVGKSSLLNLITERKQLAKTSSTPGKTKIINHYLINNGWYLTDLPGYGYARTSKSTRDEWERMIRGYLIYRNNLINTFILIDSRIPPQKIDLEFMAWMGSEGIPFSIVFTKTDKLSKRELGMLHHTFVKAMQGEWDSFPPMFNSSSVNGEGREQLLDYLESLIPLFGA